MYGCYILPRMEPDAVVGTDLDADGEVMGAVEGGQTEQFVLADVTRDDAFVTLPLADAASLPAWR
jgi:hypothetical protein